MSLTAAREWPLIAFTLLSQLAVGIFWTLAAVYLFSWEARVWGENRFLVRPGLVAVIVLLVAAAALSFFHLGQPKRAVFVLANLRRSWLSREIFFELSLLVMLVLLAAFSGRASGRTAFVQGAYVFTAVLGVFFLASMSKLYILRTVPAWFSLHTPLSFFLTALLLGPLAVAAGQRRLFIVPEQSYAFQDAASIVALAAVALIILTILLFTPRIGFLGTIKDTLLEFPARRMYPFLILRLLFLAAAVFFIVLYHKVERGGLMTLAFISAGTAEVLGRNLFYAVYSRLGV
jgi:anaerobic dimethyl sulfoxide reductase subunit C (anchor subunit)